MRNVSDAMTNTWLSGVYTGDARPCVRATLQHTHLIRQKFRKERYASYLFGNPYGVKEIPNISSCQWQRTVDSDAGTMTMVLFNAKETPIGVAPDPEDYVYNRLGWFCADPETEVLSERGWLRYDEVKVGDSIYTLNPDTGLAEWKPVLEVFAKHYDGTMIQMESRSMSALVTPNHRWAVTNKYRRSNGPSLVFKETDQLAKHDLIPKIRNGEDRPALFTPDFAALVGWVVSDGTYDTQSVRVTINQSSVANPAKCEEIRLLLKRLQRPFTERVDGRADSMAFFRFSGELAAQVRNAAPGKKLTMAFIESLDHEGRYALLEALRQGDGGYQGGGTAYLCTADEEQAGIYAALIARCGLVSRTHRRLLTTEIKDHRYEREMFYVNIKRASDVKVVDTAPTEVAYSGIVWCPRTENGTFFARRAGRTYFTGNTFNRGDDTNPWNHQPNGWTHRLHPDMLIKTYEGYGHDNTVTPDQDTNLLPSGVWLIDTIKLGTDAMITITCRDAARLLIDQISFLPVVPMGQYPLYFSHFEPKSDKKVPHVASGGGGGHNWQNIPYDDDSGQPYFGHNGAVGVHRPSDAFDTDNSSYWLSVGNGSPTADYAYEWVQGAWGSPRKVSALRIKVKGGPYRLYVSLHHHSDGWLGKATIPYNPNDTVSAPNGADIKFVKSARLDEDEDNYVNLKDRDGIDKIRLTFHDLWDSGYGEFPFRAAVRDIDVLVNSGSSKTTWDQPATVHYEGNYRDYSDIAKWLLAYGGFFWPYQHGLAFQRTVDDRIEMQSPHPDLVLLHIPAWTDALHPIPGTPLDAYMSGPHYRPLGDIWGDIEQSGTYGPADLTSEIFDKKPLMDGINYLRDLLGFIFYIDETGGAVFRSPNIWSRGNNVIPAHGFRTEHFASRTDDDFVVLKDYQTIKELSTTVDTKDFRQRVVVSNAGGTIGAVTKAIRPYGLGYGNLRRVSIWSDQHFTTEKECRIMADMISIQQMFAFRTNTIRIPGYPKIQIDDQVKIQEPVTEATNDLHYVTGISSNLDNVAGTWWYDVDTHWLGDTPFSKWMFSPDRFHGDTQNYLKALGKIT